MAANTPVGPQAAAVLNVAGRITASTQARGGPLGPVLVLNVAGRITANTQARSVLPVHNLSGSISGGTKLSLQTFRPIQYVSGRISARTQTALRDFVPEPRNLSGRIGSASQASLRIFQALLTGRIFGGAIGYARVTWLAGRASAASKTRLGNLHLSLAARVSAQTKIQVRTAALWQRGQLSVTIAGRSRARIGTPFLWQNPGQLTLRIGGRSSARLRVANLWVSGQLSTIIGARSQIRISPPTISIPTHINLTAKVSAISEARLRFPDLTPHPLSLFGSISGAGKVTWATGRYATTFAGRISARTSLLAASQSRQNVLFGTITAAAVASLVISELIKPLPDYPSPFPTFTTLDYLNRITSEHNQKPKYMATVADSLESIVEDQQLIAGIVGLFDLDYSVGQQEDFTGQWIGKSRWIEIPSVFFTWDDEGNGWNQANWKGPADSDNSLERLDDYHYRLLLYATIIANHWDGSIPQAYAAWDTLFEYAGLKVIIQDYGNMTMLYGLMSDQILDQVLLSLFLTGQMDLRPEGVALRAYALQPSPGEPFFAWDSDSDSVHGWNEGYWGVMVPPGQGTAGTQEDGAADE
jgi:hypothetical protein